MRRVVVSLAPLAALALLECGGNPRPGEDIGTTSQASTTVCGAPTNGPVQGVDVSHYQGAYGWAGSKTSIGTVFGYASIGDGTGYVDPEFTTNWANMKAAGVLRGAYEYFEPGDDPTAQANLMIQAVGQLGAGDLPCMVDVETTGGQSGATIAANVRIWLDAVQAGTGKTPMIYTGPSFWDGSVGDTSFGATPLWIADYGPSCPAVPNGWSNWTIWQYGDTGGNLDQDVFNGTLAQLTSLGQTTPSCTNACVASARVGVAAAPTGEGYWIVDTAGGLYADGDASFFGDLTGGTLAKPVVGVASTPGGQGYWMVAADGGIFSFGNAGFYGSEGGKPLNKPVVGMAAAADGQGYWMVAADGGIFNFGSAGFFGSAGGMTLNKPVVGMAATPTGKGYWLVAADGGIFSYGDAAFEGSAGSTTLNAPIVGMAATSTGKGYWLVGADGGIFSYGDAVFHGSAGAMALARPIVGMTATVDDGGYWLVGADGGIFSYGDAVYLGNGLASSCGFGVPAVCVVASNGCTVVQAGNACAAGQTCQHGTCQSTCTDACTTGSSRCSGGDLEVCGHYGSAPCNTWSTAGACPSGQTCTGTVCASPTCSDSCETGATECMNGSLVTCTSETDAGCRTWSAPTACQGGATCHQGGCVTHVSGADAGVDASEPVDAALVHDSAASDGRAKVIDASVGGPTTKPTGDNEEIGPTSSNTAASGSGCGCGVAGRATKQGRIGMSMGLLGVLLVVRRRRRRPHD